MPYFSKIFGIEVRDEIAEEFRSFNGKVLDSLAGLHEIRARMAEEANYELAKLMELVRKKREKIQFPSNCV